MPAILEFPTVVQQAIEQFGNCFANQPQRDHFGEYLTGLYLAQSKTVQGIQREFAPGMGVSDQSCLNRFLTEAAWDEQQLNQQRLDYLQQQPDTRYHQHGIIAIDNVLIDHAGEQIADVGYFWDHAEQRSKIAHDYLLVNYVCPSGKHYPLDFRRFQKREHCELAKQPFTNHTELCCELINWTKKQQIPGVFVFDSYFANAEILNLIHQLDPDPDTHRAYVGAIKSNRKVQYRGRELSLTDLAQQIASTERQEHRRGDQRQWTYSCKVHIDKIKHPVRVLFVWKQRRDETPALIVITNQMQWEATKILDCYRQRWTGTETFHRDGKQSLGMGDCQLRSSQGQTRHMYLVMMAYSLLLSQLRIQKSHRWMKDTLTTIGECCRELYRETLAKTIQHILEFLDIDSPKLKFLPAFCGLK